MSFPDLREPLRAALLADATISAQLPSFKGSLTVFTRRPVDSTAPYPLIVVSPDISVDDEDGLNDRRPIIVRDISVYGLNDTAAKYSAVETIARAVRDLFHRQRLAITVSGWTVTAIRATGPIPAPVDDEKTVARMVSLTIQLAQQ